MKEEKYVHFKQIRKKNTIIKKGHRINLLIGKIMISFITYEIINFIKNLSIILITNKKSSN